MSDQYLAGLEITYAQLGDEAGLIGAYQLESGQSLIADSLVLSVNAR